MKTTAAFLAAIFQLAAQPVPAARSFQPEDLFRVQRVGATAWSPDGRYAAIEFTRPGHTHDLNLPSSEIRLLDTRTRTLRTITSALPTYMGFFNAVWSPDGRRLAFLSVDTSAVVRPWVWTPGAAAPVAIRDLDARLGIEDTPITWIGNDRVAVIAWDAGAKKSGDLYTRIFRGRNAADGWKLAFDGTSAAVSALESGLPAATPAARLVAVDLRTNARITLARGGIHRVSVSADQRFIAFQREAPAPVASYFEVTDSEAGYAAVNWGTERHVIDARTGAEVPMSSMPAVAKPTVKPAPPVSPPRADARRLSQSAYADAALYVANAADGSRLWLCSGTCAEIWRGNEWMREIKTGRAEPIAYTSTDGQQLTAWLLLPPDYAPGTKLPMMTVVYPGLVYGATQPSSFSPFNSDFEHPQLFAALGYAMLLASMPPAKNPAGAHELAPLTAGVLPAIDAVIARGIVDPERIGVIGQSDGGFATQGLITQTNRFRSAISSAGFSDLVSLYGSFYGQFRYGDAGPPLRAQALRALQMEKGVFAFGGPPWQQAERYRAASSIFSVDKVQTPIMLVHGDIDFIPIQQDEEFFSALYRQDKRAEFVRYQGEWHTISNRANVLDLWRRMAAWLAETMGPRP